MEYVMGITEFVLVLTENLYINWVWWDVHIYYLSPYLSPPHPDPRLNI